MADHNRYRVDARAAGRMVLVRSHAERIVALFGEKVVADHPRNFSPCISRGRERQSKTRSGSIRGLNAQDAVWNPLFADAPRTIVRRMSLK